MFRPKSTFEQWRIFQAVVDCGGYAQAAEALNKSQSSLNHAVAKLQQSLGVALLGVRGRKAVLTPAGEIFLKRARQLSQQDQLLAIPLVVGAVAEPLADEDADHRVHRVEEPHQEDRLKVGTCSATATPVMKVTARNERETGSGLLRAADSKLIEIPLIWKKKGARCGRAWRMAA